MQKGDRMTQFRLLISIRNAVRIWNIKKTTFQEELHSPRFRWYQDSEDENICHYPHLPKSWDMEDISNRYIELLRSAQLIRHIFLKISPNPSFPKRGIPPFCNKGRQEGFSLRRPYNYGLISKGWI
jgi:hypothetical protein